MRSFFLCALFVFCASVGWAQTNQPLIFQGCETADNQENCSILKLASLLAKQLNTLDVVEGMTEDQTVVLSIRLGFFQNGEVNKGFSIIYNALSNSHEEYETVLDQIPTALTAVSRPNEKRLTSFSGFFTFKKINGLYKVTEIANEHSEEFQIIDRVPIYKGCNPKWDNGRIVKCNSKKINAYFKSNFKSENLDYRYYSEGQTIKAMAIFFIEIDGSITIDTIDVMETSFKNEIERVITNFNGIEKQGFIGSKAVRVPQRYPIALQYSQN